MWRIGWIDLQCLQSGRILSCPPTSHTVKEMFLYSTVSTLKPGMTNVLRVLFLLETRTQLTDGGDCGNDFTKLELVQDGRLASSIETDLQHKFR